MPPNEPTEPDFTIPGREDKRVRQAAAAQSERFGADEIRVTDDGDVRVRDQALKREAAKGSPFPADSFRVTDDGDIVPPDPTERVDISVFDDDISGDVELVGPDGQRQDLGATAGGDEPFLARIDAPDRKGEYEIQVGGETVERFEIGAAGAAVDDPGNLARGWNGTIIDADRRGAGVTQEEYVPSERFGPDEDTVAGAGAGEALQAGVDPEDLAGAGPISEGEGEAIAEALAQADARDTQPDTQPDADPIGEGMSDQQLATRGSEANRRLRERVAAEREGLDASQVDLVATDDGLAYQTDGAQIGTEELDFGDATPGVAGGDGGRQDADVTQSKQRQVGGGLPVRDVGEQSKQRQVSGDLPRIETGEQSKQRQVAGRVAPAGAVRAALDPDVLPEPAREGQNAGAVDFVLGADENPAVTDELTGSGGLLAEEGDRGAPVTDITGVSERDLRDPDDNILPGLLPTREQVRRGGADEATLILSDPEQRGRSAPDTEGVPERAIEGAATASLSILNPRQRAADAETIIEAATNAPGVAADRGAGEVGETVTAVARQEGEEFAARAQSSPVRTAAGVGIDVFGGAVALGRTPSTADLRAEVDPRIGLFGETIESRALGLRDRGDDGGGEASVETTQTRGDQVAGLPGERVQTLDPDAVDEARGVSDPPLTSLARGRARRGASRLRSRVGDELDRVSVATRVGSGLGGVTVRRDQPDTPDAPTEFDPSRSEVLAGSPRDRISDDIASRQRQAVQRIDSGAGGVSPFGSDDTATFDPTADADTRARADRRRDQAQQRSVDETAATPEGRGRTAAGGVTGGVAGALARQDEAQQLSIAQPTAELDPTQEPLTDPTTDAPTDTATDTLFDADQAAVTDPATDAPTDTATDTLLDVDQTDDPTRTDPTLADPDTPDRDPRDPDTPDRDPRDPDTPDVDIADPDPAPPLGRPDSDDDKPLLDGFGTRRNPFTNPVETPSEFLGRTI